MRIGLVGVHDRRGPVLGVEERLGGADRTPFAEVGVQDREGAQPGTPIPRADWVRNVIRAHDAGGSITGIAVHDFGTVAIASFSQSTANTSVLIVDVWRQAASDWKLAVRYTSNSRPAPSGSSARPRPVEIPKKY